MVIDNPNGTYPTYTVKIHSANGGIPALRSLR